MSTSPENALSFEAALAQLDEVVRDLEDGQTSLESSLSRYEQGVGLLRQCYKQLGDAEQRILLLAGTDPDGRPLTQDFQHAATSSSSSKFQVQSSKSEGSTNLFGPTAS